MRKNIKIQICSIKALYNLLENNSYKSHIGAVICSEYPLKVDKLKNTDYIQVEFEDITEKSYGRKFRIEMAELINGFVENLDDEIKDLFFCCDSGASRSPALAAAYMRYLGRDEMDVWKNPHFHPNPLVYKIQSKSLKLQLSPFSLKYKIKINELSFKKAINQAKKVGGLY